MSKLRQLFLVITCFATAFTAGAKELSTDIRADYESYLKSLYIHFHKTPELSTLEFKTAARMAKELRQAGFEVTEGVGGTGVVAMLKNGDGPLVLMRADMDGLPVKEKSGLEYASQAKQKDPITGNEVDVMHACGHDVHITSLVGTARQMAKSKDTWSGTLMFIVQPAEERVIGARAMMEDGLYERFGIPDYALGFHVWSDVEGGKISVTDTSPFAGADTVDIIVHGVGAHGASPHAGKDPIVLGSQIVLALQTLISRELSPRQPAVVTVGSFHSGTKHNIISDRAVLQLTVRNTNLKTRKTLLDGIARIAKNMGRVAGLPEDKLPEVKISSEGAPPTLNTPALAQRLRKVWSDKMGESVISTRSNRGMGAEDYPQFILKHNIPSVYFFVGGTDAELIEQADAGGKPIPSHHSPLFKVNPDLAIPTGIEATVVALKELMPVK